MYESLKFGLIAFPGEIPQNFLVLKGQINCQGPYSNNFFPVKIIIPQGFPFHPPKAFLDMQISIALLQKKTYLGQMNAFKIPYLLNWQTQSANKPNLVDLMGYITSILTHDPPIEEGIGAAMMSGYNA